MSKFLLNSVLFLFIALITGCTASSDWRTMLDKRLPEYGHRNWIVVADSAYPRQSAAAIETIYTDAGQVEVLKHVLKAVDESSHVQPIIMLDAELEFVTEAGAPGVENYRLLLEDVFAGQDINVMPHEEIINKLDKQSELFNVLLLKTDMTIPYTSVFIELDCGYWGAEKEKELRGRMAK